MSIPSFGLKLARDGATVRIAPSGELDVATAPELVQAIEDATGEPGVALVLDLRDLTFMDSTGLRALAETNARADSDGFSLTIVRGSQQIDRVLEISGLGTMLPLVDAPPA